MKTIKALISLAVILLDQGYRSNPAAHQFGGVL
jgi:hypothetical protein